MGDRSLDLQQQVLTAFEVRSSLQIRGAGSKPWMAPAGGAALNVIEHRGVVAYEPTELVITVRAGTPLAELEAILADQGQVLGVDCPDFGGSTVGGALAVGWSGSGQPFRGGLRDFVLGVKMINGRGQVLDFGGQVMKNVAGYDVPRLLSGSLGQLGVILDVSLKVLPAAELETTLVLECENRVAAAAQVLALRRRGEPITAAAFYNGILHLRCAGSAATARRLQSSLAATEAEVDFWQRVNRFEHDFFSAGFGGLWRRPTPAGEQADVFYDWGGELGWSYAEPVADAAIELDQGPRFVEGAVGRLQERVAMAFDPQSVFRAAWRSVEDAA